MSDLLDETFFSGGGDEADDQQPDDLGHGADGRTHVGRYFVGADVVHAEPAGEGQRHEQHQPDEAGILNPGLGAGGDLSDQGARGVLEDHGVTAEDTEGHHQRYNDLHGRYTRVAQTRVQPQGQTLHPLREEEADVGHRRGEVAATKAR